MALNLSTLTSSATSGDVLAEMLTTADFLEPVPLLKNLARGSNKGGNAKQGTALNQPKALPLINGKGYLYLSGVTGNYASVPDAANLNGITNFVMEAKDVTMADWATGAETFFAKLTGTESFIFRRNAENINLYGVYGGVIAQSYFAHGLTGAATASIRVTRVGTSITAELDSGSGYVAIGSAQTVPSTAIDTTTNPVEIGTYWNGSSSRLNGKIGRARIWNNATSAGDPVLDVDFTATNVRHNDTKFKCASGQTVTINQAGNDPATIIKKSVLRFDGVNDGLQGLFGQTITDGYMFAAFSVLGSGGDASGRVFSVHRTGGYDDYGPTGLLFSAQAGTSGGIMTYNNATLLTHDNLFDDANGDVLHQVKALAGNLSSKINNADLKTSSNTIPDVDSDNFNIGSQRFSNGDNAAIDLEYLALFPASITDSQADRVRNYINNRNNVFDFKDGFGHYFYDPQDALVGAISTGSSSWNGRIVGSDNGDADKYATQGTTEDQPVGDGYVVTFADNTDHLDIPSTTQAGWQVVGTSLGTFAYKVNNTAVTELNLLGNLGNASYRKAGDLYGVILLPESATGKDIEDARKLLIDRGASEGFTGSNLYSAWYQRGDIVEFKGVPMPEVLNIGYSFASQTALVSFPAMSFPALTSAANAFQGNASMNDFGAIQAPLCTNFTSAWQGTTALTSFPSGAKLGTAVANVNFNSAWRDCTGLTSFPALDLSNGTNFTNAWHTCTGLTSFPLIDTSSGTNFAGAWAYSTGLTSFPPIDTSAGTNFYATWLSCTSLTSFPLIDTSAATNVNYTWYNCSGLTSFPLIDTSAATNFSNTWRNCSSLTSFPANFFDSWNPAGISTGVFNLTWDGCPLTAQSVENILTSISASGKYATTTGASGGSALADAGIDIDYDGTTLSAATNTAVASLKSKGWSIIVNNVTL